MAWTQTDVDAMKASLKRGVRSVAYADRTVTYHSLEEMLQLLSAMEAEVNASSGSSVDRFSRVGYSRG